jgi:hypothetical protein
MKAYPFQHKNPTSGLTTASEGMELRDWFAGMALQGILPDAFQEAPLNYPEGKLADTWSAIAYEIADAMMKARKEVSHE